MCSPPQYEWIPDVECLEAYAPGGYHPIEIGDLVHYRYSIVDKLGHGGYSTVWLASDSVTKRLVALKVGTAQNSDGGAQHEREIFKAITALHSETHPGRQAVPDLLDVFSIEGPNGVHACYTMTPALCSLTQANSQGMFPLDVARILCGKLARGIACIHSLGYVHCDLHMSNLLIKLPSSIGNLSPEQYYERYGQPETVPITRLDGLPATPHAPRNAVLPVSLAKRATEFTLEESNLVISDFGESFHANGPCRLGKACHTPQRVRPPEAYLEPDAPLSFASDIWQLALAMWNIVSMQSLFSDFAESYDSYIAEQIDILGPLPSRWQERWAERYPRFFHEDGRRKCPEWMLWSSIDGALEEGSAAFRRRHKVGVFGDQERAAFLDLLRQMLVFLPERRLTAQQVMQSEWMVRWVEPEVQRCQQLVGALGEGNTERASKP